jgi:hypothetical protein
MAAVVPLKDIIEAVEMQLEEATCYFDTETGAVEAVTDYVKSLARGNSSGEGLPEWQKPEFEIAKALVRDGRVRPARFRRLPDKFDVHEWSIMESFAQGCDSESQRDALLEAIHGAGAFRRFKSTIRQLGIEDKWHSFREEALKEIAIEWCESEGLAWK